MTPSLEIGNGNWAVKSDSLLGYKEIDGEFFPREIGVTRATTATRINEDGLVELTPYNLLTWSEEFDNVAWVKDGTVTPNTTIAPNGTLTADTWTTAAINNVIYHAASVSQSTDYTFSFYVKRGTLTDLTLSIYNVNGASTIVSQNYYNQTSSTEWVRITKTFTTPVGCTSIRVYPKASSGGIAVGTVFFWGAQLVEGSTAKDYLPTTDRLDIARIDYSTGEAALLVEPQRTNSCLWSEQFDNAWWTKSNSSVSANSSESPSGVQNADTLTLNDTTTSRITRSFSTTLNNQTVTASVYIKAVAGEEGKKTRLQIVKVGGAGGLQIAEAAITLTDEWVRYSVTLAIASDATNVYINPITNENITATPADALSCYLWGAQLEAGAYPTSYIPTTSAAVTRNEDYIVKTGVSDLIDGTKGTLFIEASSLANDGTTKYFSINNGTNSKEIVFQFSSPNNTIGIRYINTTIQTDTFYTIPNTLQMNKFVYTWQQDKFELWYDGTKVISDTSGNVTTGFNRIEFRRANGTIPFYANMKAVKIWKEVLTDEQCIILTII